MWRSSLFREKSQWSRRCSVRRETELPVASVGFLEDKAIEDAVADYRDWVLETKSFPDPPAPQGS